LEINSSDFKEHAVATQYIINILITDKLNRYMSQACNKEIIAYSSKGVTSEELFAMTEITSDGAIQKSYNGLTNISQKEIPIKNKINENDATITNDPEVL
jgi:hypothetical protein